MIEDIYGAQTVKLPGGRHDALSGDAACHRVDAGDPRRAARVVLLGRRAWCATTAQRALLFDLDMAIVQPDAQDAPGRAALVALTGCYHNLLRMWAEAMSDLRRASGSRCISGSA